MKKPLTIRMVMLKAYENSKRHGFHTKGRQTIWTMLGNIHTEVSEAWEEARNGNMEMYFSPKWDNDGNLEPNRKPEGLPSELADIIIRVCDTAAALGVDLEDAIIRKMKYNESRPKRHGGKVI